MFKSIRAITFLFVLFGAVGAASAQTFSPDTLTPSLQASAWPKFRGGSLSNGQSGNYGATGVQRWEFRTAIGTGPGTPIFASPIVARGTSLHSDGLVYFADLGGTLHAIDELTGLQKWSLATGNSIYSTPTAVSDGTVYVCGSDGFLTAVDGATGFVKWSINVHGGAAILSSPAIDANGNIVVTTAEAMVVVGPNGSIKNAFGLNGTLSSPAISTGNVAYEGFLDGRVLAIQIPSGAQNWSFSTQGFVDSSPAIGPDGTVYVGSGDGNLYALNGNTGALKWSAATMGPVYSSPAIATNGLVYVGSEDGSIYAFDSSNGSLVWSFTTNDSVFSSPAVASDGTVYVGSDDGNLYALTGDLGGLLWTFATQGEVVSSPAIDANGSVFVTSYDGTLYAIGGQTIHRFFSSLNTLTGAGNFRAVIQMSSPAGPSGDVIILRSNSPLVQMPGSVTIPPGQTGVSFPITALAPSTSYLFQPLAIFGTNAVQNIDMGMNPYPISNFFVSPSTVTGGSVTHGVVQLAGPAGPGGNVVTLGSNDPTDVIIPATVTVPAGKTGVSFSISTKAVTSQTQVTMSAQYAASSLKTTTLTITP